MLASTLRPTSRVAPASALAGDRTSTGCNEDGLLSQGIPPFHTFSRVQPRCDKGDLQSGSLSFYPCKKYPFNAVRYAQERFEMELLRENMSISFPEIRVHCSDVLFTPSNFSLHIRYTTNF
jgi:hypothetical protein